MNKSSGLLTLIIAILSVLSCAPPAKEHGNENSNLASPTVLEGYWEQECSPDSSPFGSDGHTQEYLLFERNKYVRIQRGFSRPTDGEKPCAHNRLIYTFYESASFSLQKKTDDVFKEDGAWNHLDWGKMMVSGQRYKIAPLKGSLTMEWNTGKLCGFNDWQISKSKSITNKECYGTKFFRSKPRIESVQISKAEGAKDRLSFGPEPDGSDLPPFSVHFNRIDQLPFKYIDQEDTQFVKGNEGN